MRTKYYCVNCGKQYEALIQDGSGIVPNFVHLTCTNDSCKAYMQTTSPNDIKTGRFMSLHKLTVNFDYLTGNKASK